MHACMHAYITSQDLAAGLIASRDIAEGEAINFDYDETEDDLRDLTPSGGVDRGGFEYATRLDLTRIDTNPAYHTLPDHTYPGEILP